LIGFEVPPASAQKVTSSNGLAVVDNDTLNEEGDFLVGANADKKGYVGVRTKNHMYAEFLNGDKELYDLRTDPLEINNIVTTANPTLLQELQGMLGQLRQCAAATCRQAEELPVTE
jgi:hypothetical protein